MEWHLQSPMFTIPRLAPRRKRHLVIVSRHLQSKKHGKIGTQFNNKAPESGLENLVFGKWWEMGTQSNNRFARPGRLIFSAIFVVSQRKIPLRSPRTGDLAEGLILIPPDS